jgi:hypothetical protein
MPLKFLSLLLILLTSCHFQTSDQTGVACLPDQLFALKNLGESIPLNEFFVGRDQALYYKDQTLTALDSVQERRMLQPFVPFFSADEYTAFFVSKQPKLGEWQPVILRVSRATGLYEWLVIVDKDCKPVSRFILEGENCEAPVETDSTVMYCPVRKNKFVGNRIESYEIRTTRFLDDQKKIIDSLSYITEIDERGMFQTKRKDSVRFTVLSMSF